MEQPSPRFRVALAAWGPSAEVVERLRGARNEVWLVRVDGRRYAGRLSARGPDSLEWELRLLAHLDASGLRVPLPLAACNGQVQVDGLALFSWLEGTAPSSKGDWGLVADALTHLHAVTQDWPQRPGFSAVSELTEAGSSGDAHLNFMPAPLVTRLLAAWQGLQGEPLSVVHGDPGAGNVRIDDGIVGLLDWDEARVDVSLLDFGAIATWPPDSGDAGRMRRGRLAAMAWEIANAWLVEPDYARRCVCDFDALDQDT